MKTNQPINRRQVISAMGVAALYAAMPASAQAEYPNKPIKIVIPLPAGGAADVTMRAVALELEKGLKQPVVIENKPGGLFQIGVQSVLSAPADGHTLLYIYSGMVSVQAIQKQFDLVNKFNPITASGESPTALVVGPDSKFKTIKELIEFGRANPGKLTYSTLGPGSIEHLKSFQLTKTAGFEALAVPYKGGPDAVKALIGGEVDFIITPAFFAQQFAPQGKMKVLAAMDTTRLKSFPDAPTIVEAGVNVPPFRFWSGLLVHADTPPAIAQRLHKELLIALYAPSVLEKIAATGAVMATNKNPEDFRKFIASEAAWMEDLAKQLKLEKS